MSAARACGVRPSPPPCNGMHSPVTVTTLPTVSTCPAFNTALPSARLLSFASAVATWDTSRYIR